MNILFMCVANSARSQLAEGMAKTLVNTGWTIMSAGSKPSLVNPFAIRALEEVKAPVESLYSKSVEDLPAAFVEQLDVVITLCAEEVCPVIITRARRLHWPLPDPAGGSGSDEDQMETFRATRDEIMRRLVEFQSLLD